METHERKAGRPDGEAGLRRAPFADLWQQQGQQGRRSTAVVPREEEGAEVEAAGEWYASGTLTLTPTLTLNPTPRPQPFSQP